MDCLEDVTDRLLIRSQDAILQLELWVQQQEKLLLTDHASVDRKKFEAIAQQRNLHLSQLNSLCLRSRYIKEKLASERNICSIRKGRRSYIENLVYEFQDIAMSLNELSETNRKNGSPVSQATTNSSDSFEPKPLRILERQRTCNAKSPTKRNSNHIKIPRETEKSDFTENVADCLHSSLPSSPLRGSNGSQQTIRLTKSYHESLNGQKPTSHSPLMNPFNAKNRLSLYLFDNIDEKELTPCDDDNSDQETVMYNSPVVSKGAAFEPLRRYNSHESILSVAKKAPIHSSAQKLQFYPSATNGTTSAQSVFVSSKPVYTKPLSVQSRSKDLLSSIAHAEASKDTKTTSVFNGWNLFGKSSTAAITSEVGTCAISQKKHSAIKTNRRYITGDTLVISTSNRPRLSRSSVRQPHGYNRHTSPITPIVDHQVRQNELSEALETELLL
ncbi:Vac17p KNAG_0C00190 [Huiozyma naganishii CBS 8797]|uniref:Uncharacterized protein n=1 Tax=Huiozyma naganishii (strain ATCC MYA-139 / BCRC 22969 / CBS 8797 / KCTC 17520 / NBRC 10181 / NCYC 3082 / Yp74L-3) TaxID=1071383 RepID=J7RHW0_HUIN7|nr:hypothetical protein KNAG_0C00190 [Kazachstania naganishii CBS 8797]CCK69133.1 hypothetical protein KNAG_0C00190 [Kazachstania naganishii CBS 8797]